jgi:hypothetical protein
MININNTLIKQSSMTWLGKEKIILYLLENMRDTYYLVKESA